MLEAFFGFKKTPFGDSPDPKQLFASQAWNQAKVRLQFLADHHGAGLLTGEVGAGKSTAARTFTAALNPNLYKILYLPWTPGSTLDLLRQLALELDLEPAHLRGDLVRQISSTIVRLNQTKKQHPILICDEAQLLCHSALEQLPLLLNFDMDSSRYLTLLLVAAAAPHPLAADARAVAPAHRRAVSPGRPLARGTRRLPRASTEGRRRLAAAV
jgi:general secretion pathway protein A